MKITKRQLRQIIREGSSYEEIKRIRDSGDYSWRDMEWEVVDLMESMQTFPAQDVIDIMYSALDSEDREDSGFWHMMLSDGGHLYEALDGLKLLLMKNMIQTFQCKKLLHRVRIHDMA